VLAVAHRTWETKPKHAIDTAAAINNLSHVNLLVTELTDLQKKFFHWYSYSEFAVKVLPQLGTLS